MAYRQNDSQRRNDAVRFDLMEHIGVLSRKDNGWTREVNIVSWNDGAAKVDIREWDPEHKRMTKGVTLFDQEAETLTKVLAKRYGLRLTDRVPGQRESAGEESRRQFFEAETPAEEKNDLPASVTDAACVAESDAGTDAAAMLTEMRNE